jgi:nucleotide-binding universal stress UspA family protein
MAFPYKTILCPVDFDENSMVAVDEAVEIARHFGSTLKLIHVVSPEVSVRQEKDAETRLSEIAKQKLDGLTHESHVQTGDVVTSILAAQAKDQPDLLVMATHGRRGLARTFLGSVTEAILRNATCPVLSIRFEIPSPRNTGSD